MTAANGTMHAAAAPTPATAAPGNTEEPALDLANLPHELVPALGSAARIGLVVLATDHTIEHEWQSIFGPLTGVALYHARIENEPTITPDTLKAMEARLTAATDLLLPGMEMDVVAYGCTSASMVIDPEVVEARIHEARPNAKVTNPFTASLEAFKRLGVKRVALLTPYTQSITDMMRHHFEEGGLDVRKTATFNEESDNNAARISPLSIKAAAETLGRDPEVEAVFVSCTSLRAAEIAEEAEAEIGKPVVSSNLAMAWHTLQLAGYRRPIPGYGRLFRLV